MHVLMHMPLKMGVFVRLCECVSTYSICEGVSKNVCKHVCFELLCIHACLNFCPRCDLEAALVKVRSIHKYPYQNIRLI
jgi:hypothetical protein